MEYATTTFSGFSVDDLDSARTFYVETLGVELLDDAMGLDLRLPGGGRVFVYPKDDHQPATFTVLNFVVDDIDAAMDALLAKGITFEVYKLGGESRQDARGILRGREAGMGPDIAWFKDPAGNILSILQKS